MHAFFGRLAGAGILASILSLNPGALAAGRPNLFQESGSRVFKVGVSRSLKGELMGHGTGFVVGEDGLVATAFHVIEPALDKPGYEVFLVQNGGRLKGEIVAVDALNDIAILKVAVELPAPWPVLEESPALGSDLFVAGYPGPAEFALVKGTMQSTKLSHVVSTYQVSAPVTGGVSGGPVLTPAGQVVGLILAQYSGGGQVVITARGKELNELIATARKEGPKDLKLMRLEATRTLERGLKTLLVDTMRRKADFHGWRTGASEKEGGDLFCRESEPHPVVHVKGSKEVPFRMCTFKLGGRDSTVWFLLRYSAIPKQGNQRKTASLTDHHFNSFPGLREMENHYHHFACRPGERVLSKGRPYLLTLCTRKEATAIESFHTEIHLASLDFSRPGITASLSLLGFSEESVREILPEFLDSLEVADGPAK